MSAFRVLLVKELREQIRTMRFAVVVAVFGVFGILSPLLAKALPDIISAAGTGIQITVPTPTTRDAVLQFTKNVGQIGALIAILISMGAVATEKERGTAAFLLTKPIARSTFLLAKVVAIGILLAAGVAVSGALSTVYTAVLFEPLPVIGVVESLVVLWLSLAAYAAVTFLASVVARSAIVAGGVGFVALIAGGILSAIPAISPYTPNGLSTPALALTLGLPATDLVGPIVGNLGLIVIVLGAAGVAFRRQEL